MAVDKKISQLASGAPAQAGDEYVVARSGANYKLTLTNIAASMPPIGATTPDSGAFTTLSASSGATISGGNLTFSSTAQRITGDMSNATLANRLAIQTSTANGATRLSILPNGTGTTTAINLSSNSDPTNASLLLLSAESTVTRVSSTISGTGTYLPLAISTGGSERVRVDTAGNVGIGTASPSEKLEISGNQKITLGSSVGSINLRSSSTVAAELHIRPNSTKSGWISFTEDAVADRWLLGIVGGNGSLIFGTGNPGSYTERARITSGGNLLVGTTTDVSGLSGVVSDAVGNLRAVPQSGSAKTGSYTLAKTDVGEFINVGSGGSVTVPDATFATGDVVSIFNDTTGNVTLTMSITTAYIGGVNTDRATITLATRGVATILFISGTVCVVTGNVS